MAVIVTSGNSPYDVSSGQTDTGDIVSSGGSMYVLDGGTAIDATVSGDGYEYVYRIDSGTTVGSGGSEQVESGGVATGTTVSSGGYLLLGVTGFGAGGTASGAIVGSGGFEFVNSGGVLGGSQSLNASVSAGGLQYVAGDASDPTVLSGGSATVGSGGSINGATAVADRHIKEGGRITLVLPAAVVTGVAWGKTRDLINHNYVLESVVASHDPERWNFSENTDLSEVLLIAQKRDRLKDTDKSIADQPTQFINLWTNPTSSAHALAIAEQISRGASAPLGATTRPRHDISEIVVGTRKYGESIEIPWGEVRAGPWLGCTFAQTNLVRTAWMLRQGRLYIPGRNRTIAIPVQQLGKLGNLGPDRRDIAVGFTVSTGHTPYPALMGHRAELIRTIAVTPNRYLSPRTTAAAGRPRRDVGLLWPRAGRVMIAERSRLNTQRCLAVRLVEPGLSNVWWPLRLKKEDEAAGEAKSRAQTINMIGQQP
jgi:autotransporter passenger strand-loop-strand repeat protein